MSESGGSSVSSSECLAPRSSGYCKDCGDGRSASRVMNEYAVCSATRNNTYPDAIDCDKSRDHLYLEVALSGQH